MITHSKQIYELGYAIPAYDINRDTLLWIFKDKYIRTHKIDMEKVKLEGFDFPVVKIEDVLANEVPKDWKRAPWN